MTYPIIAMDSVESSQIHSIGHDGASTLAVQFKRFDGTLASEYHYANVTPEQFAEFKAAPSIGKHFAQHFKTKVTEHPYIKIIRQPESDQA